MLPIVLYTGTAPWGSNRRIADLLGPPVAFHAFAPPWEPIFWNLAEQTPEALLNSGAAWLQLLAVMRVEHENLADFLAVLTPAIQHLATLHDKERIRWDDLLHMVVQYALARRPPTERDTIRDSAAQADPPHKEEVIRMVTTIADALREEGRAEGIAEGELRAYRDILRRFLSRQFGPLPDGLLQQIETCGDIARLTAAIDQVSYVKSLSEFSL